MYLVASSSQETFGGENFDKYIADENTRYTPWAIYDNSATIYAVADSSRWYPSYSKYRASLGTTAAQVQLDNSFMSPEGGMGEGDEDFELGSDYTDFETLSELGK